MSEPNVSRGFRAGLRAELPRWSAEGLIDARAAGVLAERYGLNEAPASPAILVVFLLGAALIGGGVLSLVAYNWEALPDAVKLGLLGSLLVGVEGAGYWLWKVRASSPRLGHALIVLASVLFGANIGLVAQVFHVHSNWYNGFGAFAVGALAAALLFRSAPNAVLACGLATTWAVGLGGDEQALGPALAVALAAGFFVLAGWLKSRLLHVATAACACGLFVFGADESGASGEALYACGFALSAAVMALPWLDGAGEGVARPSRSLALLAFAGLAFPLSFRDVARDLDSVREGWLVLIPVALAIAALAVGVARSRAAVFGSRATLIAFAAALLLAGGVALELDGSLALLANLSLLGLAAGALWSSVKSLARTPFWAGSLLLAAVFASRFFEFETELWLKGAVLIALGVAVIAVGLGFERRVKAAAEVRHAP